MKEKRICLNQSVLDFMESKLTPESFVLELGGGYSSPWFAERCRQLLIVETNPKWTTTIKGLVAGFTPMPLIYPKLEDVQGYSGVDLVLVDCVEPLRFKAAQIGWNCLAPSGWLIFDDAQRPQHFESNKWLMERARQVAWHHWKPGDVESARDRLASAYQKAID